MGNSNSSSRTSFASILKRLCSEDVDPADQYFWDNLWKTPLQAEEIFDLLTPDVARGLISQRPSNLQTLFTQAVAQLYQVVETPYPIYFEQALNCARILSRLLPFMLENTTSPALRRLIWVKQKVPRASVSTETAASRDVLSGDSNGKSETGGGSGQSRLLSPVKGGSGTTKASGGGGSEDGALSERSGGEDEEEEEEEEQETEPLAVILINSIFHLLFLPDFTIEDPNVDFTEDDLNTQTFKSALMWAPGVGCREKTLANSSQYDKNRIEILRLLVSACCDSLFQNPDGYDTCESLWLEVGTSPDVPYAEITFYSLMNVVLGYDPIGYGLPYGQVLTVDSAFSLMEKSIQALIILLDFGYPLVPDGSAEELGGGEALTYVGPEDENAQGFNIFRKMLRNIVEVDQLNFIFRGFSRLLNNVHLSQSTYLPHSVTRISIEQELMVLLWKCLEEMPSFLPFLLKEALCDVNELVVPICFFLLEGRKDPAKLGMLYLCTFVLLKLSGERNFSVALSKPYTVQLPIDMPLFQGSHADLLIIVLHKLMVNGMDKLSSLYTCFLTIICNITPYCKTLCSSASTKLVNLLELFSSPRLFFATESNYSSVMMLLESLNNLVQYQYEGNFNLVYSILSRRKVFEWLNGLTLPTALEQARPDPAVSGQQRQQQSSDSLENKGGSKVSSSPVATTVISLKSEERAFQESQDKDVDASKNSDMAKSSVSSEERVPTQSSVDISSSLDGVPLEDTKEDIGGTSESSEKKQHEQQSKNDNSKEREVEQKEDKAPGSQVFVPTTQWLERVKKELPLHTLMRLLRYLVPLVEEMATLESKVDELSVLSFIRRTTMVGLLPVPHPIVIRKYQPNRFTSLWFTAFMWGVIFLHNSQTAPKMFDGRAIRLFIVQGNSSSDNSRK